MKASESAALESERPAACLRRRTAWNTGSSDVRMKTHLRADMCAHICADTCVWTQGLKDMWVHEMTI